jgi:alkylation response protein AidB-like acyl-CoA dehydrogenase
MEFNFTQEQSDLQQRIRDFCSREIAPGAGDLDAAEAGRSREMIRERLRALGRGGLLGLGAPGKAGGAGGDLLSDVMLHQELGEACPATALSVLSSAGACARSLREWGGSAERDAFLEGLLSGETIGAFADLEPGADLDAWALKTAASLSGSGFGVTGKKAMVLNAPVASACVVTASVEGGTGLFLVALGGPGTELSPSQAKLGCRGVPTAELILKECPAVRLAPEGGDEPVAVFRGRVHLLFGAVAAGMVNAALVTAGVHARDHRAGDKPLARHQEISFKLAEMFVLNDTARMLLYRGLWRMEEKDPEAPVLASCAKVFASEAAVRAAQWALQITGEQGYLSGSRAERIFRDAKLLEILGDCSEKHRMFVADRVLAAY